METLRLALPYKQWIVGVGLDSSEVGHPPEDFEAVFEEAGRHGLRKVAHAGEEGPPSTSGRPWTTWGSPGSTTASGAWRTPGWSGGSKRNRYRLPSARSPT
jgi:hypothetical protein